MLQPHRHLIELDRAVLKEKKFLEANPELDENKPCVYVGMTGRTPEERFEQHKRGYKYNKYAKKYGIRLKPRLFSSHNPMTYEEACDKEKEKARRLRNRAYAVWQK